MTSTVLQRAPARLVGTTTASLLAVLAMTTVHHVYGAALFDTPWRLHIVYVSAPVALALLAAVRLARTSRDPRVGRWASGSFLALGGLFVIGAIGIYEGGYNHLLPNVQYLLGIEDIARGGLYAPPDDLLFQLSGIAQLALAIPAARSLVKLVHAKPRPGEIGPPPGA